MGGEEPGNREREMPQNLFWSDRSFQPRGHLASAQKKSNPTGLQVKKRGLTDHGSAHSSEINLTSELLPAHQPIEQIRRKSHNGHSTEIHANEDQEAVEVRPGLFALGRA
jgi:hypothetical protein